MSARQGGARRRYEYKANTNFSYLNRRHGIVAHVISIECFHLSLLFVVVVVVVVDPLSDCGRPCEGLDIEEREVVAGRGECLANISDSLASLSPVVYFDERGRPLQRKGLQMSPSRPQGAAPDATSTSSESDIVESFRPSVSAPAQAAAAAAAAAAATTVAASSESSGTDLDEIIGGTNAAKRIKDQIDERMTKGFLRSTAPRSTELSLKCNISPGNDSGVAIKRNVNEVAEK
ncbi:hypothetical protein E2C01_025633 [Portunus trituberculatus]|uniref:Uncharacterized protein n=1 Tax=Portunus trituberculatus TaxID=210409 RepID=A0A5B7EGZ3_PORTR|nr:hypothetical protein [Portunus trituberculatus]